MMTFRTYPHLSAPNPHLFRTSKPAPIRTAAPPSIGVRGCGAEGSVCGGSGKGHRTAPHLMENGEHL